MLETRQGGFLSKRKGWFIIPGIQDGDRTVDEQALGLEGYDFTGKTVLDLGSAECLISAYALMEGAKLVHGCEIIEAHLKVATSLMKGRAAQFWSMNLNSFKDMHQKSLRRGSPPMLARYDVVLMLSIIHKLADPLAFLKYASTLSDSLIIRLPSVVLSDERSGFQQINIPESLPMFDLVAEPETCRCEWMGIFQRRE